AALAASSVRLVAGRAAMPWSPAAALGALAVRRDTGFLTSPCATAPRLRVAGMARTAGAARVATLLVDALGGATLLAATLPVDALLAATLPVAPRAAVALPGLRSATLFLVPATLAV